ncbi:MAG: cellulase family glycosylhydrolase [Burkholderiales bacterium]|nr:cellulase family glycosylhydrolase [Burkholderiales bacterium]
MAAGLLAAMPDPARALPPEPASFHAAAAATPLGIGSGASREAWAAAAALSRGITLSLYAAPREGDWGLSMDERWIDAIAKAGFRSVRIPVRWSNNAAAGPDARLDEVFARRIDRLVDAFLAQGLVVVLGMCNYSQFDGLPLLDGEFGVADEAVQLRFVNLWRQISRRHALRSGRLLFELYNNPHGTASSWNTLASAALTAIRQSDARRVVIVGPVGYGAGALPQLALPQDRHWMAVIHHGEPLRFVSQGRPWVEGADRWLGTTCCDAGQLKTMAHELDLAQAWSQRQRRPVWLGRFGAASAAPPDSRARYLRAMRDAAESRGIPWTHTDFAANFNVRGLPQDSGIYDVVKQRWHTPLLDALLGP